MTGRLGQPERAPMRSLSRSSSTSTVHQRPTPHRPLSHQFPSFAAPPRRPTSDGFIDLDPPEGLPRSIPRSRLNLEIGKDAAPLDLVQSPRPIAEATPTVTLSQSARGRPQLHVDASALSTSGLRPPERGHNEAQIKPIPLPVRPGQYAPPYKNDNKRQAPVAAGKKDARPKPYVLEVPAAAPRYPDNGVADFFPWTGNHPEDQFSETIIRHGYFDKAQMTLNETGAGKNSILPALKHKSGLQTLSSLFASVLAQRRARGQISTPSTFKPPPRVTVTDTKREMWLRDLANPTISLRRLSRSIPHGIRGKVLLEQSLSKNIPIERAVWLAKCVGANELRSFRRKGASGAFAMGGEAKWIRDFTVSVEQFVESMLVACGDNSFKVKINYALRLVTHFHAEHLLDREHFAEWLVSALEHSPETKLPIWLLITQIYWKDILLFRRYGRRLVTALLNQLARTIKHPDRDILAPLSGRLKFLIKGLIISSPDSFFSPDTWMGFEDMVQNNIAVDDETLASLLADISSRNRSLIPSVSREEIKPRKRLVKFLDTALSQPFSSEMPLDCWGIDGDKAMLCRTVLEWSTSSHRPGMTKVFVATRILRLWAKLGAEITEAVLNFVESGACDSKGSKRAFYHLISELARSQHFSTGRYLQWLIARGGLADVADVAEDGPCATRLLAELPTHNLSDSIIELRTTLLDRVGCDIEAEEELTRACMLYIMDTLPGMQGNVDRGFDSSKLPPLVNLETHLTTASRTVKSEVGLWLRQAVKVQMLEHKIPPLDDWDNSPIKNGTTVINLVNFSTIRRHLILIDDFSMLADTLKIASSCNDAEVLAACADTVNLHLHTFAAIGALKNLFDLLLGRIRSLAAEQDSAPRGFLVSMSDLASRIPEQKLIALYLHQELARSDRKTAADACSPVSDHMALMQTAESDFTDEIERVLASGNSMDHATLDRLFQKIILRLEESFDKSPEQQRSCGLLLTRLKTFDADQFNHLMTVWVTRFLGMKRRPAMVQILGPLISLGCYALSDVITILTSGTALKSDPATSNEALALILGAPDVPEAMSGEEACRLRIKQSQMQKDSPRDVLHVIRYALQYSSASQHESLYKLLQRLVLFETDLTIRELTTPLSSSSEQIGRDAVGSLIDRLLLGYCTESPISTEDILNVADDLTLPFCQLKLASMFHRGDSTMSGTDDASSEHLEAFDNAIESAVTAGRTSWASIIPLLDISVAKHLRQRAQAQFLGLFPNPKAASITEETAMSIDLAHAKNLLHIIEATAYSISDGPAASTQHSPASDMVTTLNGVWLTIATTQVPWHKDAIISSWLPLLLSFITIHRQAFQANRTGHELRARLLLALTAIYLELKSLDADKDTVPALSEQIFDLALYMVDSLPDEMRTQCVKGVRDATSDPRIRYLFSVADNPSEWLMLSRREKPTTATPAGNSGGTTAGPSGGDARAGRREREKLVPFPLRRWEMLGEPTPNIGENDTSLNLTLFGARKG